MDHRSNVCYDAMDLYITPEYFIVKPKDMEELLIIDRTTNYVKVQSKTDQIIHTKSIKKICGILGTIPLIGCNYLIVATHRLYVGKINGAAIWRLDGYDIIPYIPNMPYNSVQLKQNEIFLKMLRRTLCTPHFYFSYVYHLTHTLQRTHSFENIDKDKSLIECADKRFVWNAALLNNFNCSDMQRFQLPLILGYVFVHQSQINGQTFFWSLISRRSVNRAGTRYFTRGINDAGQVANFVETEQIIEYNGHCISFVQIRGSLPFYWQQLPNLRYKPQLQITPNKDHLSTSTRHFNELIGLYGRQVIVNLIDQKGGEGKLENLYRSLIDNMRNPNIRYEAFDFHSECKKMRWDRLSILIDRLAHEQDEFSVFHIRDKILISTQKGVFRVNCIDCLDRTNVVQSLLAKRSLRNTLENLGILQMGQTTETASQKFELIYKAVWANNASIISFQYAGTGALKTDFTRTGKRSISGVLRDGINSLLRYYVNNFSDGFRQDGIDMFLGRYVITSETPIPLEVKRSWRYRIFPPVLLLALAMLSITALMPPDFTTENLIFMLFWSALISVSVTGIFHYSYEFVDLPRFFRFIRHEAE